VLLGVFGAVLQAMGAVVAHRAPLSLAEADAVRADVGALRNFFVADGAGLPEAEVRAASTVLLKTVEASIEEEDGEGVGYGRDGLHRSVSPVGGGKQSLSSRIGAYAFGKQ
jgi:hypothetical protein